MAVAVARQVSDEGLGGVLARIGKVLDCALGRVPGRYRDEGIVLVMGEVLLTRHVCRDILRLLVLAGGRVDIGDIEDAKGILVGVDALSRQRLDVVVDIVAEAERVIDGLELVVVVVDEAGVGEVDGEDADTLSSCGRGSVYGMQGGATMCDVLMLARATKRITHGSLGWTDYEAC